MNNDVPRHSWEDRRNLRKRGTEDEYLAELGQLDELDDTTDGQHQ
jgi:hypothetical protein